MNPSSPAATRRAVSGLFGYRPECIQHARVKESGLGEARVTRKKKFL